MACSLRRKCTVAELIAQEGGSVKTGPFGTTLKASEYAIEGVPLISVREIIRGGFHVDAKTPRISSKTIERLPEYLLREDDIVFARKGSVDRCARVGKAQVGWFLGSDGIRLRPPKTVDARFLAYSFQSQSASDWLLQQATGSTMASLNQGILLRFPLDLPPLAEQQNISQLLGALDDRIDLLRQTNATLEAIAQALFKSWFVDFDPVRAKVEGREPEGMDPATAALFPSEFEESELGLIPKGWKVLPLSEVFEINPRRAIKKGSVAPYLDMASVPTSGHVPAPPVERKFSSGSKFLNGDTLLARITPCLENGKTAHVDFLADEQVGWGSTEFIVLRPKPPLPLYFGYLIARHDAFRTFATQAMTGTSGRQRVELGQLERFQVVCPDDPVSTTFGLLVEPIRACIYANQQRSEVLAKLRDTLLPRLISGKLRLPKVGAVEETSA